MSGSVTGGFIVCKGGRLEPTGELKQCLMNKTQPGSHIAVRLTERKSAWAEAAGYWAEVVITPPVEPYEGPPSLCLLPEQFERFRKNKTKAPGTASGGNDDVPERA
jgi:hypothetical protein